MTPLELSIEQVYKEFADVRKPHQVFGCSCCTDPQHLIRLAAQPLRSIGSHDIGFYGFKAVTTIGDGRDYLYFLPRILELSVGSDCFPDLAITAGKIAATNWQQWPPSRRKAVVCLFREIIERILHDNDFDRIGDWLCAATILDFDIVPILARLQQLPAAVLSYFEENAQLLRQGKLSHWQGNLPNSNHDAIVNWLKSDAVLKILRDTYCYQWYP